MIEIRIDQLVLSGLSLDGRRAEAIRLETVAELERLLARHGLPPGAGQRAPSVRVNAAGLAGRGDREVAAELAQAIYRALG